MINTLKYIYYNTNTGTGTAYSKPLNSVPEGIELLSDDHKVAKRLSGYMNKQNNKLEIKNNGKS